MKISRVRAIPMSDPIPPERRHRNDGGTKMKSDATPMMYELFNEPFDIRADGTVHAPGKPGLGYTLRPEALQRFKYVEGPEFQF